MGLDMYLTGCRHYFGSKCFKDEEGYPVEGVIITLGYWRKHADLHGYIVREFAEGEDNCQDIDLSAPDIHKIIDAIKTNALPETDGFFFRGYDPGELTEAQMKEMVDNDVEIFTKALGFLAAALVRGEKPYDDSPGGYGSTWRSVTYRASW